MLALRDQHTRIRDRVQYRAAPAVLGRSRQATSAAAQPDHRATGVRRDRGGSAVDEALQADHLRDARGDRVLDMHSHLLTDRIIWVGTAIDAGVANALIAQPLFREPDSPDSKVQLSVNCDSGDPPLHRNHLCGAGTRCRNHPDLRRDRDVLTVDSSRRVDRLRAGSDHDRVLTARQAQQ